MKRFHKQNWVLVKLGKVWPVGALAPLELHLAVAGQAFSSLPQASPLPALALYQLTLSLLPACHLPALRGPPSVVFAGVPEMSMEGGALPPRCTWEKSAAWSQ